MSDFLVAWRAKIGGLSSWLSRSRRLRRTSSGCNVVHALVLSCAVLGACSTQQIPTLGGIFATQPSPTTPTQPTPTAAIQPTPVAYYAGEEGLRVYSEPRASSSLLGHLPLHQKVYRHRLEKGYAYVNVEGKNLTGWVDNAKLIWRLPRTTPTPSSADVEPPVVAEPPTTPPPLPSAETSQKQSPVVAEPVKGESGTEHKHETPPTESPLATPPPAVKKDTRSIFDPF